MLQQMPMSPIRRVRERLGVTQETLADGIDCTPGNISHYERGQAMPPARALRLIAFAAARGHTVTFDDIYDKIAPASVPRTSRMTPTKATSQQPKMPGPRVGAETQEPSVVPLPPVSSDQSDGKTGIDRGVFHADGGEPLLLTAEEVAALLNCQPKTVEEAARSGRLPGFKYGRSWRFSRSALMQALHEESMRNVIPRLPRKKPQPVAVLMGREPGQYRARPSRRTPIPTLIDFGEVERRLPAEDPAPARTGNGRGRKPA